jgi:trans-2,3-dihydro-3-hydroxyanthranilate isomerase
VFDLPRLPETSARRPTTRHAAALGIDVAISASTAAPGALVGGRALHDGAVARSRGDRRCHVNAAHWKSASDSTLHAAAYMFCRETARAGTPFIRACSRRARRAGGSGDGLGRGAALPAICDARQLQDGDHSWCIEQAYEMGRPSLIELT